MQAALALGRGLSAQKKPQEQGARREVAAHVQAALRDPRPSTAQLKGRGLGRTLQRMAKQIDVLGETRKILSVGRGNVLADIKKSKGESLRRVLAAGIAASDRTLRMTLRNFNGPEEIKMVLSEAIGGIIMKAGNCQEHAAIAFLLANRDYNGQDLILMSYEKDHAFVLVGDKNDLDSCVVIDVWDPSEHGKKYSACSWYKKSKVKVIYTADGKDYIAQVEKDMRSEEIKIIHDSAYQKAEGQTRGIEDVTDPEELEGAYKFSIYDF